MIITAEELERRLKSQKNIGNSLSIDSNQTFRTAKVTQIGQKDKDKAEKPPEPPRETKALAGILATIGQGSVKDIAADMGMSTRQVHQAKNLPEVKLTIDRVREIALDKMMLCLQGMSMDKFDGTNIKDLSTIAANMSRIIEKTAPKEINGNIQLLVYAPQQREERFYKCVDVS